MYHILIYNTIEYNGQCRTKHREEIIQCLLFKSWDWRPLLPWLGVDPLGLSVSTYIDDVR